MQPSFSSLSNVRIRYISSTLVSFFIRLTMHYFSLFSKLEQRIFSHCTNQVIAILLIDNITFKYHDNNDKSNDFHNLFLFTSIYIYTIYTVLRIYMLIYTRRMQGISSVASGIQDNKVTSYSANHYTDLFSCRDT